MLAILFTIHYTQKQGVIVPQSPHACGLGPNPTKGLHGSGPKPDKKGNCIDPTQSKKSVLHRGVSYLLS